MQDLFPNLRATMKAHTYFATTLSGFKDSESRFKFFKDGEAPTDEAPFITVEIKPGEQDQLNGWAAPYVMFHVIGPDTDWATLWAIAEKIRDIIQSGTYLTAVGSGSTIPYQMLGKADFDEGRNPVTEQVYVSVGMQLGFDATV